MQKMKSNYYKIRSIVALILTFALNIPLLIAQPEEGGTRAHICELIFNSIAQGNTQPLDLLSRLGRQKPEVARLRKDLDKILRKKDQFGFLEELSRFMEAYGLDDMGEVKSLLLLRYAEHTDLSGWLAKTLLNDWIAEFSNSKFLISKLPPNFDPYTAHSISNGLKESTPEELAFELGISPREVYEYMNVLNLTVLQQFEFALPLKRWVKFRTWLLEKAESKPEIKRRIRRDQIHQDLSVRDLVGELRGFKIANKELRVALAIAPRLFSILLRSVRGEIVWRKPLGDSGLDPVEFVLQQHAFGQSPKQISGTLNEKWGRKISTKDIYYAIKKYVPKDPPENEKLPDWSALPKEQAQDQILKLIVKQLATRRGLLPQGPEWPKLFGLSYNKFTKLFGSDSNAWQAVQAAVFEESERRASAERRTQSAVNFRLREILLSRLSVPEDSWNSYIWKIVRFQETERFLDELKRVLLRHPRRPSRRTRRNLDNYKIEISNKLVRFVDRKLFKNSIDALNTVKKQLNQRSDTNFPDYKRKIIQGLIDQFLKTLKKEPHP